jgi:hypothetical protein
VARRARDKPALDGLFGVVSDYVDQLVRSSAARDPLWDLAYLAAYREWPAFR